MLVLRHGLARTRTHSSHQKPQHYSRMNHIHLDNIPFQFLFCLYTRRYCGHHLIGIGVFVSVPIRDRRGHKVRQLALQY